MLLEKITSCRNAAGRSPCGYQEPENPERGLAPKRGVKNPSFFGCKLAFFNVYPLLSAKYGKRTLSASSAEVCIIHSLPPHPQNVPGESQERVGEQRGRRSAEGRTDVLNISGVGLSGIYKQGMRPVEPVQRSGQESMGDTESGSARQQEQSDQPSFGQHLEAEFMKSLSSGVCPNCGSPVYQNEKGRPKIYCSDACRFAWKNKHPKPENWKSTRKAVCLYCGREFLASREYQSKSMYCSRACANRARAEANRAEKNQEIADESRGG